MDTQPETNRYTDRQRRRDRVRLRTHTHTKRREEKYIERQKQGRREGRDTERKE